MDEAKSFYGSAEYAQTKMLREGAGAAKFVAIDGYPIEQWQESVRDSAKLVPPSQEPVT